MMRLRRPFLILHPLKLRAVMVSMPYSSKNSKVLLGRSCVIGSRRFLMEIP